MGHSKELEAQGEGTGPLHKLTAESKHAFILPLSTGPLANDAARDDLIKQLSESSENFPPTCHACLQNVISPGGDGSGKTLRVPAPLANLFKILYCTTCKTFMHYGCLWPRQPDRQHYGELQIEASHLAKDAEMNGYNESVEFLIHECSVCVAGENAASADCVSCFKPLGSALSRKARVTGSEETVSVHQICALLNPIFKLVGLEGF